MAGPFVHMNKMSTKEARDSYDRKAYIAVGLPDMVILSPFNFKSTWSDQEEYTGTRG